MLYYVYNNDVGENKDVSRVFLGHGTFTQISLDGGTTWENITTFKAESSERFRAAFSLRNTTASSAEHWIGFESQSNLQFPCEPGHLYLAVCDVRNSGVAATGNSRFGGTIDSGVLSVVQQSYPKEANQTTYTRVYRTFAYSETTINNGRFFLDIYTSGAGAPCQLDVKNWRQFDVTGWTQAQITALATKPNFDEVYLTLPETFHGESNMTDEKFLEMGGIIRNDAVDGYMYVHEIGFNYYDIP